MKDLNEIFYGKDASNKIQRFKVGMLEIESRHSMYFSNRKSKFDLDKDEC
jgi:hypothetical protein